MSPSTPKVFRSCREARQTDDTELRDEPTRTVACTKLSLESASTSLSVPRGGHKQVLTRIDAVGHTEQHDLP